jgi:hypothetical protein
VIIYSNVDIDKMDINDCIYLMDNEYNLYFDTIDYDEKNQHSILSFKNK